MDSIAIVPFEERIHGSLLNELTELLHSAYRPLAELGLKYVATHQPPEVTLRRLKKGNGFLGFVNDELVATITLVENDPHEPCEWYQRPEVFFFTQFAVKPSHQGSGFGKQLMDYIETTAMQRGAKELSLDTSEHAHHLIDLYKERGYRFIGYAKWSETNYRSVVLSKALDIEPAILA